MKLFHLASAALLLAAPFAFAETSTWKSDPAHSEVDFTIKHLALSNVHGRFGHVDATLVYDDKDVTKSTVKATIDMTADYEFATQLTEAITRWRRDLKANWLNANIPKPAVDAMLEWLDARFDVLAHNSAGLASSDFFNDNYERMATVLAIHEIAMQLIIIDMARLIMSINGSLDNIVYKNLTITPAKDVLIEYFEQKKISGG